MLRASPRLNLLPFLCIFQRLALGCQSIKYQKSLPGAAHPNKGFKCLRLLPKNKAGQKMSEPGTEMEALPKLALKY
jgi:hypothetical protein